MGKLINIDNGGTLTDVCVIDGARVLYTKVLTTPHDLSQCLFDGLKKAAALVYGEERVVDLLRSTDCIRYSTTQGTNALVERKGPRLGLILRAGDAGDAVRASCAGGELFAALVGERVESFDPRLTGGAYDAALVGAINALTAAGTQRLVVSLVGAAHAADEARFKRHWLRAFPRHLLGAVPVLCASEIAQDPDDARRTWTALLNAFLHPGMERFLYHAEHRLRDAKYRHPLLVFRNDGDSARVAKTVAIKTYSSGPRGGMEGARALAAQHGCERLLSLDVGGTSADIGRVDGGAIADRRRGEVEGMPISFPLSDVVSLGIGGSSVIRARGGRLTVGPDSVGAAPGPACFGLGGTDATITDAFLLLGVLDPSSFFGGGLQLDAQRAERAVSRHVAEPLGLDLDAALVAMRQAWVRGIADGLAAYAPITPCTTLAAFGGAGPLEACAIAEQVGIDRVIIPGRAAVFSAFGIGFSDIAQRYEAHLAERSEEALAVALAALTERARRDMFAEGFDLDACHRQVELRCTHGERETVVALNGEVTMPPDLRPDDELAVALRVVKGLPRAPRAGAADVPAVAAAPGGARHVLLEPGGRREVPLFRTETQAAGARGRGPAIIEEAFFTCRVPSGWRFAVDANHDIVLERAEQEGERS